ncbi:exported hypothetical protein [Rubrivivax sp. A210]|uniref:cistern family PEP-CTERM protein n=1 Tax=Rubrivivax sp. A210 TaxID=2772301 RepID=UPI0019197C72|nr:cistern family PEP-CTERM protein [Rubrivivax sp. A210]CAD5374586.1 exported hypothetical protein [Rubrivivax sp. A210]
MSSKLKTALAGAIGMICTGVAVAAPVTFDAVGDTAKAQFSQSGSTSMAASMVWTLTSAAGRDLSFHVVLDNLSASGSTPKLAGFGLTNLTPNPSSVGDDSTLWDTYATEKVSLGGQEVEFCSRFDGASSNSTQVKCDSSSTLGLAAGGHSEFNLTLRFGPNYSFQRDHVRFDSFLVRFTQAGSGENSGRTLSGGGTLFTLPGSGSLLQSGPTHAVPEPATFWLAGLALLALPLRRRAA